MKNLLGILCVIVIAGLVMLALAPKQESGSDRSNRIATACYNSYADEGNDAVTECRFRETARALDAGEADRQRSADAASQ